MFTLGDIRNIAIQIEENGEETYRKAARAAGTPEITEILEWMADEEQRHARWFANLRSKKVLTAEQREIEAMGRTLLQDMVKGNPFLLNEKELEDARSVQEVVTRSITFEQDTIVFYEFLLGFIDDAETTEQLQEIIEEERGHMRKLEKLHETGDLDKEGSLSCRNESSC
ncbi:MAG: ferritin family protein [Desulforhopalus sp.]